MRALAALLLALLAWRGLRWFERANLYFPSKQSSGIIPASLGMAHEEVSLRTSDGVRLHGWYLPAGPRAGAGKGLTLLYCHGNAGNISGRVFKAAIFHRLGLSVLLFDYRGYGQSEGTPSEQGTYRDAEAAYRWLAQSKKVAPDRLVVYGESLGNGVAVETALRHPARALILESAFTSVVDMGRLVFPFLPVRLMVTHRYDNLAKIPKLRVPVLVMHSRDDEIVPFAMGERLFAAAPEPKEFLAMKGGHDEGYIETGEAYPRALGAFLEGH